MNFNFLSFKSEILIRVSAMNRFLHEDLRPQNVSFSLGRLEEVKEQAGMFFEASRKLNNGTKLIHKCQLTPPEIVSFPKIGNEVTKPILLFMGQLKLNLHWPI